MADERPNNLPDLSRNSSLDSTSDLTPLDAPEKIEERVYNQFKNGTNKAVDYVIVYECDEDDEKIEEDDNFTEDKEGDKKKQWSRAFLRNIKQKGLELEIEDVKCVDKIHKFIKCHIPFDVLTTYAEELGYKVPFKPHYAFGNESNSQTLLKTLHLPDIFAPHKNENHIAYYSLAFQKSKMSKYVPSTLYPAYFTTVQRQNAVLEILNTTFFGMQERGEAGIKRLVQEGVFIDAFALHDGPFEQNKEDPEILDKDLNPRAFLHKYWSRFGLWYKHQPLDQIRAYFGEKIGFYFAWLGAYTTFLLLPSIVGLVVFIYNIVTRGLDVSTDLKITRQEICTLGQNITMCPLCLNCSYWNLSETCGSAEIASLVDNPSALFFAFFMSLWAVSFLEYWKRKNVTLAHQWECLDFEEEERPRSEFTIKATTTEKNKITGKMEPAFPKSKRYIRIVCGITTVLFMISIVIIFIFGIVLYRTFMNMTLLNYNGSPIFQKYASNISSISGAILNLIFIVIIGMIYEMLAYQLTEWEMHKTQTEFENNLIFKVFIFQFVNFYSSIFYLAFIKGKFTGYPGHYTTIFGYRQEDCNNGGCLIELTQQIMIILTLKQIIGNIVELLLPKVMGFIRRFSIKVDKDVVKTEMEEDFELVPYDGLFEEYLEMAAFPLAPLFAMLNNWTEIRLDAQKLVCDTKRPAAERAANIGVWSDIITALVNMGVVCNAFLIAFTSEILPKFLYRWQHGGSLVGYIVFSLSYSPPGAYPQTCRYRGYRDINGNLTNFFWELMVLRLAFVLIFEHIVFTLAKLIEVLVPDVPAKLEIKIKRERYLAKTALHESI